MTRTTILIAAFIWGLFSLVLIQNPGLAGCSESTTAQQQRHPVRNKNTPLSREATLSIAQQRFGASVLDAIPFSHCGSPEHYIAVAVAGHHALTSKAAPPKAGADEDQQGSGSIFILKGTGTTFKPLAVALPAFSSQVAWGDLGWPTPDEEQQVWQERRNLVLPFFGVTDIDQDGCHEVYAIATDFSTGSWEIKISLYDSKTHRRFELQEKGKNATQMRRPVLSANSQRAPKFKQWLLRKSLEILETGNLWLEVCRKALKNGLWIHADQVRHPLNKANLTRRWIEDNGLKFTFGPIKTRPVRGTISDSTLNSVFCQVDDGRYQWVILFKGNVMVYDKQRNRHFVLYVQDERHFREIETLVVGKSHVWLALRVGRKLVAIDKASLRSEGFTLPKALFMNLQGKEQDHWKDQQISEFGIINGRLAIDNQTFLPIPPHGVSFNPKAEFQSAQSCVRLE